jgi:hypothetical protein
MVAPPKGALYLARSGVNKVGVVRGEYTQKAVEKGPGAFWSRRVGSQAHPHSASVLNEFDGQGEHYPFMAPT